MSITGKRLLAVCGVAAASLWLAAPASADDQMPPCTLGIICAFVPGALDLDHDVDLTKDQPPMPNQDSARPVDPCINGCI
ncbi:fibronectin-binding protein [Mycolicibacterium komossense]|uniref:fibronectin-binding protein n=1 Tax=Mycolicibacterium komossense TaxID=1779 RepID=UPI0021F399CC|nr:fibronectin-binding protein [Mycolicibacterium komossense]